MPTSEQTDRLEGCGVMQLRRLVITSDLKNRKVGVNQSLLYAVPFLEKHAIHLSFLSAKSVLRCLYHLGIQVLGRRLCGYDFVIFNDPGPLGFKNRGENALLRSCGLSGKGVFIY